MNNKIESSPLITPGNKVQTDFLNGDSGHLHPSKRIICYAIILFAPVLSSNTNLDRDENKKGFIRERINSLKSFRINISVITIKIHKYLKHMTSKESQFDRHSGFALFGFPSLNSFNFSQKWLLKLYWIDKTALSIYSVAHRKPSVKKG